jgi:UDP-perosamine 4-acetyltransferase
VLERLVVVGAATPTIIRVIDDINAAGERALEVVGFVDNAFDAIGPSFHGFAVLGGFDAVDEHDPGDVVLINTIAGSTAVRSETTAWFTARGYRFTNVVHPGVNLGRVELGVGNLIYEGALLHPFTRLGDHCVVSSNAGVAHESVIGDGCFIGPASYVCGAVELEPLVYVGAGATVLPRLRLGRGTVVAAGAVVNRSAGTGAVLRGVPARPV